MENKSPQGLFLKHDRRARSEVDFETARRNNAIPQSIDKDFPIFSRLNVQPNAYANYRRAYYDDNMTPYAGASGLRPYTGAQSMPQARYQFADPRFSNFSASRAGSYQSLVAPTANHTAPSYASSEASSFARGGAKAKADAAKHNLASRFTPRPQNRIYPTGGVPPQTDNRPLPFDGERPWYKRKMCMLSAGIIGLIFIALIVLTIVFGVKAYRNSSSGAASGPQGPTNKITIAFPFGYSNRTLSKGGISSQEQSLLVQYIILNNNDGSTKFALQPYNANKNAVIQSGSFADSLRELSNISPSKDSSAVDNPDLSHCVEAYNRMVKSDPGFKHYYIIFVPNDNYYNGPEAFENDMVTAVKELTIAASAAAPNNASVVAVYDSDNFASKFRAKMPGLVLVNDVNKSFGNILRDILDASKISKGSNIPPPLEGKLKITFSFPIAHLDGKDNNRLDAMHNRLITAIMDVIMGFNDGRTTFAFQQYSDESTQRLIDNLDFATALRDLNSIVSKTVLGVQPSQHSAIQSFFSDTMNDRNFRHSYVIFTPEQDDYRTPEDGKTDMDQSEKPINSLQAIIQSSTTTALIICNSWSFDILGNDKNLPDILINGNGLDGDNLGQKIISRLSPGENPQESAEFVMTFAFNIAHNDGKARMKRSPADATANAPQECQIMSATIDKYKGKSVAFIYEIYAGGINPPAIDCTDAKNALEKLKTVCALELPSGNPSLAGAISNYQLATSSNTTGKGQPIYLIFPPQAADYSDPDDFKKDMSSASANMAKFAKDLKSTSAQSSLVIIADAQSASYFANVSDVGLVNTSGRSVDEIMSSLSSEMPVIEISITTPVSTTSSTPPSPPDGRSPPSGDGSSTPTIPTITIPSSSITQPSDGTAHTIGTVTPEPPTAPSGGIPSTSTHGPTPPPSPQTNTTIPILPHGPFYNCTGDIVMVFDASDDVRNWDNRIGQYRAGKMIASHLRLLGNVSTIRISVASVGAVYEADSALLQPFYDNYTHVNDAIIRVAANLPDDEGIPPISVGNMLTKEYCESTDPEYKLNPQTPTTFIIFSGWPGDIPNPVSDPWFSCSTAPNRKVFMVGIEESTEKLDLLGVPSTEFYRKMTEFTWEAMEQLAAVIDSKICGDPQPAAAGSDERLFRASGSHGDIPIRKDYDEAPLKCTHRCYEEP